MKWEGGHYQDFLERKSFIRRYGYCDSYVQFSRRVFSGEGATKKFYSYLKLTALANITVNLPRKNYTKYKEEEEGGSEVGGGSGTRREVS